MATFQLPIIVYQQASYPRYLTTVQTQVAKSRITIATLRTQVGKARIGLVTPRT